MRIREPDPGHRGRWSRRLSALTLVWAVVAAIAVVPLGLGTAPQAHAAGSTTVTGPKVWQPASGSYGPEGSVTVSQTGNLTNQVVQVSWSGFTPTVGRPGGEPVTVVQPYSDKAMYPVRIYQCRGEDPAITDCYGSTLYGGDRDKGFEQKFPAAGNAPDFPSNAVIAPTGPDGSGAASIEILTGQQAPTLGCDAQHKCSIVVEPNYGGDPLDLHQEQNGVPNCDNHAIDDDGFFFYAATDSVMQGVENWVTGNNANEQCAWRNHVVVPLDFAPAPADCKVQQASFSTAGLEMANRTMQQWRTGLCLGSSPMSLQYIIATGEPQARADFLAGTGTDLALVARPDRSPAPRPYVYAPLASTGISVVYVVDDPTTGRQIRDMKLNARLLAKMLTQSYAALGPVIPSVEGNPNCLFADPEFRALNPESANLHWPNCSSPEELTPTVVGGTTDLTYQLTSWIAADPDAAQFLQGAPDQWGMHVDTFYLRPAFTGYPVEALQRQDNSGVPGGKDAAGIWKQLEWNPTLGGLVDVSRTILQNRMTALSSNILNGNYQKRPAQPQGSRRLFAIMDAGQAQAYSLPEAALRNPAGGFVQPDRSGFAAAVADMPVDALTGTQTLPYGQAGSDFARDQRAYPLTAVQYAMVPTAGLSAEKSAAVATFLGKVTDPGWGQLYGVEPGRLAPGFLGLTQAQLAQAQDAVKHVSAQDGSYPGNQTPPAPTTEPKPPTTAPDGGGTATGAGSTGGTTAGGTAATGGTGQSGDGGATGATGSGGATGTGDATGGSGSTTGSTTGSTIGSTTGSTGTGSSLGSGGTGSAATAGGAATSAPVAAKATPGATPAATGGPLAAAPVAAGAPAPDRPGTARLLLPVALIAGLVLLVGGPAALFLGGTPAGAKALAGVRAQWARLRRRG
ncbi:hypothetical protein ACFYUY_29425 [Kitasatospora sp. NPDC004745]|uniref:hypothetical protein n=1 Tax=Kitasatospora sp. NPDC004745 TaxID=3364019 RepID=UPI00369707E4